MEDEKLKKLLQSLSWPEKIGQLIQLSGEFFNSEALAVGPQKKLGIDQQVVNQAGSVLNVAGMKETQKIQTNYLKKSRHKIPLLFMGDIIYGYRTIFPIPLGLGATWNPELIQSAYEIIAAESRAAGVHVTFAPMVDLVRDARWGRTLESTGEDPLLNAAFSEGMVKGLQMETTAEWKGIASCVKHFAAYGAGEAGREYNTVDMSERRLRQDYLSGYKAAVDAGCKLVMTSFNTYDGMPVTGNEFLLKQLLRKEWNFEGVIISDYAAIQELISHGVAKNDREATKLAMEATTDIDMKTSCYAKQLEPLIKDGEIDSGLVDEAVLRVLRLKNQLGLFEDPYRGATIEDEKQLLVTPTNRALARKVASEAIVLLQNKDNSLPLTPNKQKILLVGPYGNEQNLIGLWAVHGKASDSVSIKTAMEELLSADKFMYKPGCDMLDSYDFLGEFGATKDQIGAMSMTEDQRAQALDEALEAGKDADVIIYAMGEHTMQSGEAGSRTSIKLPTIQQALLEKMTALGKKNILISFSGRPLVFTKEVKQMDAILQAWFPGTEGGSAIVDILFGKTNPSGKLSMSFPYDVGQLPLYYNAFKTGRPLTSETHTGRFVSKYLDSPNEPLFPFGYGLSYSEVQFSDLEISSSVMKETLTASIKVKNLSNRTCIETVQLYLQDVIGSVVRPVKELKQFQKIVLLAGEEKKVIFNISREELFYYQKEMTFGVEAGEFILFIGNSSSHVMETTFELI